MLIKPERKQKLNHLKRKKVKNYLLVIVVIILGMFSSCKKELMENPIDVERNRAEMAQAANPPNNEVQVFIENGNLKSANIEDDASLIEIFPLDSRTYEIYTDKAVKYFVYYEININGYRQKMLTFSQIYPVKDGKVDLSQYVLDDIQVGCPFNRYFTLKNGNDISQLTYFFHFDDGRQFTYFGDRNSYRIQIPPIAGVKIQLTVAYDNGDMAQQFNTELFGYYDESSIVNLKFEIKKDNILSYIKIDKSLLQGAYSIQIYGEDPDNGNTLYVNYRFEGYESTLDKLSFAAPFSKVMFVNICGMNGCWQYQVKLDADSTVGGVKLFSLKY